MTIKLLAPYGRAPANAIIKLDPPTEASLISAKQATATLTGGFVWTDPYVAPAPATSQVAPAVTLQSLTELSDARRRPGAFAFNWQECSFGSVTAGWNLAVDTAVTYGGAPTLRVTTNGAPSGGTTLQCVITFPAAVWLGGRRLMFAVKSGDRAESADVNNAVQMWLNYSAGDTHRILSFAGDGSVDGDWHLAGPYSGDASGSGHVAGTAVWPKVSSEGTLSVRLLMTCAAGGIAQPVNVSPIICDADSIPVLTIFMDGQYSGQYNYARRLLNSYGLRASMAVVNAWRDVQAGTMSTAQILQMCGDGHEWIAHAGTAGDVGWDNVGKFPDGQEYALVRADVEASFAAMRANGQTRGLGYGVIPFTNGMARSQSLTRRQNIARGLRDGGMKLIRQLGGYTCSTFQHDGQAALMTWPSLLVQNSTTVPTSTVTGVVDKLIQRGGWTGFTYHDLVLSGETGNSRNVAAMQADLDYIDQKQRAGLLRVLPFSEAHQLAGGPFVLPVPCAA